MGEVFAGRYELLDLLGQGGMGSVWRVHDRRTDSVVAAKVLRQSDAAALLRFVRETAFRVQHSHVVTPLGWAGEDDRVLFTMPVVDGGSVATLVGDHGPLPAAFVAEILRQLLDALSAVHDSRIVHRDVKPANVLLAATGPDRPHAYLTDFGIAVELDGPRLTETHAAIGTPGYMAPEQRRGELTRASDLYAVGALARYMLTAVPIDGNPFAVERPGDVPQALWQLTSDLLVDDATDRPDAAAATARLQAPELAWTPGAAGDVEVLQQVFDTCGGEAGLLEPTTLVRQLSDEGGEPPASHPSPAVGSDPAQYADTIVPAREPESASGSRVVSGAVSTPGPVHPPHRKRARLLAAGVVTVAVVVVAAVLAWTSLSGGDSGGGDSATSPPVSSSSSSSSTSDPTNSSSSSSPGESSRTSPTSGSVEVGTVVSRVGQPCQFSDVGLRETTSDGIEVICEQTDGDYSWERSD